MDKYQIRHGKLKENFTVSVDSRFKSLVDQAKAKNFDFNQWARDRLYSGIEEVAAYLGLESKEQTG